MDTISHISLSLARAMQVNLETSAANLGNVSTAGFKAEHPAFESLLHTGRPDGTEGSVSFVSLRGGYVDERPGGVVMTGNPTDVAIQGDAWFAYRTPEGQLALGRDGRFLIDQNGTLMTTSGAQVLGLDGGPVAIPPELGADLKVGQDGTLAGPDGQAFGRIGLFQLDEADGMRKIEGGLYLVDGPAEEALVPAPFGELVQGAVEQSNVQPVLEMTRMMEVNAAYDRANRIINDRNDLQKTFIERIGRFG
jgi:flagellar basal-body rod protein FlgF